MEYQYPENTVDCSVTYMRTRTGPNWFRVYYKNGAHIRFSPKEVGRVFGIAKFTPTVNSIREWCKEMEAKFAEGDASTISVAKYEGESVSSMNDDQDSTDTTTKMII